MEAMAELMIGDLSPDMYPNLRKVATDLVGAGFDYADEFDYGLDLILDGIGRAAATA